MLNSIHLLMGSSSSTLRRNNNDDNSNNLSEEVKRKRAFSLLLLWRSYIITKVRAHAVDRGKKAKCESPSSLILSSFLILTSRAKVWSWIRSLLGMSVRVQKAIIFLMLQCIGDFIPVILVFVNLAHTFFAWTREKLKSVFSRFTIDFLLNAFASAMALLAYHEYPHLLTENYRKFLSVIVGPSLPVLDAVSIARSAAATSSHRSKMFACMPLWRTLPKIMRVSLVYNVKLFIFLYMIMKPMYSGKLPKSSMLYNSLRYFFIIFFCS